ncbi:MAG: hypothetical protein LBF55_02220 [Prevotellaceae bacterium]|jgi:hypothetical protein|nr:hypothetical protein [Prevotellaceae bacterium]
MKKQVFLAASIAALLAADLCVAQTGSRGVKREKEECEELALQAEVNPRASGSGISTSEAVAFNVAKLQARSELAAQVAAEVTGILRHRVEQHQMTAGASTYLQSGSSGVSGGESGPRTISGMLESDSMEIAQRVSQILANTYPICKNTYDLPNGSVQVYVCLEMALSAQRQAYKELKEEGLIDVDVNGDGKNEVDFDERTFLLELAKAREEYNSKINGE